VDDSRVARSNIMKALSGLVDIRFFEADDGVGAWSIVQRENPDVIFTDWYMQNMDGLELIRRVRQRGNATKICMLTSETNNERQNLARREGANCILTKPIKLDQLARALEQMIG
jgi:two-component system chemotaxis response regulator CheY